MISYDKVSLSACTFGAGLAHAAALALVLPILITLPAPETGSPPRLVAIPVTIMPEPPAPPVADADDAIGALVQRTSLEEPVPVPAPPVSVAPEQASPDVATTETSEDALPGEATTETSEDALPGEVMIESSDDVTGALTDEALTAEATIDAVPDAAAVDLDPPPLPKRVRRDADGDAIIANPAASPPAPKKAEPAPPRRVAPSPAPRRRTVTKDVAPYKGSWEVLLGKPALNPVDRRGQ